MNMRIDKVLANMGYGSRKEVKEFLKKGEVTVNDNLIKNGKTHVDVYTDEIYIFGEQIEYREFVYLMLNKPQGYLSATEDGFDPTVIDLLPIDYFHFEPFPIGRLDKDTEGLLLISNDGQLAHQLTSPRKEVEKTYFARINGRVSAEDVEQFATGVTLDDGYETKPGVLNIVTSGEQSEIELTITEGKFHQVKRMFLAIGKEVVYLQRIRMGEIVLDEDLEMGEMRELTEEELTYCLALKG